MRVLFPHNKTNQQFSRWQGNRYAPPTARVVARKLPALRVTHSKTKLELVQLAIVRCLGWIFRKSRPCPDKVPSAARGLRPWAPKCPIKVLRWLLARHLKSQECPAVILTQLIRELPVVQEPAAALVWPHNNMLHNNPCQGNQSVAEIRLKRQAKLRYLGLIVRPALQALWPVCQVCQVCLERYQRLCPGIRVLWAALGHLGAIEQPL